MGLRVFASGAREERKALRMASEVGLIPLDAALDDVHMMFGLTDAVAFARVTPSGGTSPGNDDQELFRRARLRAPDRGHFRLAMVTVRWGLLVGAASEKENSYVSTCPSSISVRV